MVHVLLLEMWASPKVLGPYWSTSWVRCFSGFGHYYGGSLHQTSRGTVVPSSLFWRIRFLQPRGCRCVFDYCSSGWSLQFSSSPFSWAVLVVNTEWTLRLRVLCTVLFRWGTSHVVRFTMMFFPRLPGAFHQFLILYFGD